VDQNSTLVKDMHNGVKALIEEEIIITKEQEGKA
jgi:hypothetical protein